MGVAPCYHCEVQNHTSAIFEMASVQGKQKAVRHDEYSKKRAVEIANGFSVRNPIAKPREPEIGSK